METKSFKVVVAAAGTPVRASVTPLWCHSYVVIPWHENTGKAWVGAAAMVKATGVNVHTYLPVPHENIVVSWNNRGEYSRSFDLSRIWIDADVNGEAVIITYNLL